MTVAMLPPEQQQQDQARFRLAMASAGIGMAIVSLEGQFIEVNPALCRMLGYSAEALVGLPASSLTHPDDIERSARLLQGLVKGDMASIDIEKRYLHASGAPIEVVVNAAVMHEDHGARYLIGQFRDVTAQRKAERELHDLNANLEQRVQARTAELEAANRRLEAFAFGVSHDLRAPLRTIDGFAAHLARHAGPVLDEASREQLSRIRSASTRMGGLIDSLLELARIGRAELRPADVDVSLLAEWTLAELQDAQPERRAVLRIQPGLHAVGDERLLKQLLSHLLRNAWQFSASREAVEVEIEGARDGDVLHFVVRDHGIGFDMAYANKLFEPFQRLHGSEQGSGDGIGLTIAQQIAARHRGAIRAESAPGAGASFHVDLRDLSKPRDDDEARHPEAAAA
jgi:PAS domain S-box-containing protein